MKRSQSLDVLRGIAILLVLGRHAPYYVLWTRVGWTGVWLFFVLSGFLISGLLFREFKERGTIDLSRFFCGVISFKHLARLLRVAGHQRVVLFGVREAISDGTTSHRSLLRRQLPLEPGLLPGTLESDMVAGRRRALLHRPAAAPGRSVSSAEGKTRCVSRATAALRIGDRRLSHLAAALAARSPMGCRRGSSRRFNSRWSRCRLRQTLSAGLVLLG